LKKQFDDALIPYMKHLYINWTKIIFDLPEPISHTFIGRKSDLRDTIIDYLIKNVQIKKSFRVVADGGYGKTNETCIEYFKTIYIDNEDNYEAVS